jgi:hypothetical protein
MIEPAPTPHSRESLNTMGQSINGSRYISSRATWRAGLLAVALAAAPTAHAQPAPGPAVSLAVPTTKLMAIGTRTPQATPAALQKLLPQEIRDTVQLYLQGKIDQWFVKQDQSGVVFILNVTDQAQAAKMLEAMPLGQAGLMKFEFIALGPLSPMRFLLTDLPK